MDALLTVSVWGGGGVSSRYREAGAVSRQQDGLSLEGSRRPVADAFGPPIYIPTATGFQNLPGCRETYGAVATVKYFSNGLRKGF